LKDYYEILGVRRGAGLPEIRRAYRMLVQQLHPDVNPDPVAHERIKEVNEAYDVLGDEGKKREYDYRLNNPYQTVSEPQQPVHRDPAYRRKRPVYQKVSNTYSQRELIEQYLPYAIWCCRVGLLLAFVIFADGFLPDRISTEETDFIYEVSGGRKRVSHYKLVTKSGIELKLYKGELQYYLYEGSQFRLVRTRILAIPTAVSKIDGNQVQEIGHLYRTTIFFPIILAISSALGLLFRKRVEFSFSLCTVSGILTVIIYFMIK
jgi:hypothetical protein